MDHRYPALLPAFTSRIGPARFPFFQKSGSGSLHATESHKWLAPRTTTLVVVAALPTPAGWGARIGTVSGAGGGVSKRGWSGPVMAFARRDALPCACGGKGY